MGLLKRKKAEDKQEVEGLDKVKKKDRKKALQLLEEYNKGLVIKVDSDVDQKALMDSIREKV